MSDEQNLVRVRVRYREGRDLPHSENLWAEPVEAHDGGGTYRLENHAFGVALAAGDLVRAELDGHGQLQVVDVVQPAPSLLTVVEVAPGLSEDEVRLVLERWKESGAQWSEGAAGYLSTVWRDGMAESDVMAVIQPDLEAGRFAPVSKAGSSERTRAELAADVDFDLDRTPPAEVRTDYWAGDDPVWAERGMNDPEFLAFVQRLASEDARVARALENGRHHQVLQFIERITADDPRTLPPLDGPLFDE